MKSTSCCSRQLSQRTKFVASSSIYTVQRHGGACFKLKFVQKVIDVVDCPNRRICVTLLRYKVDNPETSFAQVRLFRRKKEEEKLQQIVFVNYKLDELVYLLDVMNYVYYKVFANQPICNVLQKIIELFTIIVYSF